MMNGALRPLCFVCLCVVLAGCGQQDYAGEQRVHVDRPQYYRDNFPRVGRPLAEWCVERRIRVLGVEPPSVADVNCLNEVAAIHGVLLSNNIVIVEGLTNLTAIREERVLFGALPLKIEGGDGSPCRAFAIEGNGAENCLSFHHA